jgi:hypothetical protein
MRMQVILEQTQTLDVRGMLGQQVLHTFSIIHRCASGSHFHIAQPGMRRKSEQDTTRPLLLILIMLAFRFPRTHRSERAHIANAQARPFSKTNQRSQWSVR